MPNLNTIIYNEDLSVLTRTEQPIRAFANQANTFLIYAPMGDWNTAFVIYQGLKNGIVNPLLAPTERLTMEAKTSDLTGYNLWQSTIL